jgi:hypothetical protein
MEGLCLVPARLRGVFVAFARDERKTDTRNFIHDKYRYAALTSLEQHLLAVPSLLSGRWSEYTA